MLKLEGGSSSKLWNPSSWCSSSSIHLRLPVLKPIFHPTLWPGKVYLWLFRFRSTVLSGSRIYLGIWGSWGELVSWWAGELEVSTYIYIRLPPYRGWGKCSLLLLDFPWTQLIWRIWTRDEGILEHKYCEWRSHLRHRKQKMENEVRWFTVPAPRNYRRWTHKTSLEIQQSLEARDVRVEAI